MTDQRNIYLTTVPIDEAVDRITTAFDRDSVLEAETVPSHEAAGRITAEAVFAKYSSPTYHSAAMDGIAVKAEQTFGAREGSPIRLQEGQDYRPVNTGEPLPDFADAVIMIEQVDFRQDSEASIEAPAFPWQNVRRIGEDIVATELIFPQNRRLSPYDIGALLSAGIYEVRVLEQPHLFIIPTGDEVLDFTARPEPRAGQVIESNSQMMRAMAESWGCRVTRVPPVPDKTEELEKAVGRALASGAHIVVVGAGSSAGSKDYTLPALQAHGRILVHGIEAMPGKPSLLGVTESALLVGAPGYPVSTVVCFEQLVQPLIAWLTRQPKQERTSLPVRLTRKVPSKLGREEFLRLSIGRVGQDFVATPLARGAGLLTTLTRAQGMTRIPVNSEGIEAGRTVQAELYVQQSDLERVLVCVGSHDNTIDLLANELMGLEQPLSLASTHVGSLGGLSALRSGSAHLAGAHLYDPASGDYNFPFIRKYLPDTPVRLVNLAIRHQGLILPKGNPLAIHGLTDLTRQDVRFINRQRGAGTRILFDDYLDRSGIDSQSIRGYQDEEFTHMAVAVNVLSGAADCGMGIYAAAKALDLDFVPLCRERYDLVIPEKHWEENKVRTLLGLIRQVSFQEKVRSLGGYETDLCGQEVQPGQGLDASPEKSP
jgi:putative molybdopterin biosynthesis protein